EADGSASRARPSCRCGFGSPDIRAFPSGRGLESPHDGRELTLPAGVTRDAPNGRTADDPAPKRLRRDVRGQYRQLPAAGKAREQRAGDAGAEAATSIRAQHEELRHLSRRKTVDCRQLTHESKARWAAGHTDNEVMTAVAPPELAVPRAWRVGAVAFDAPALPDEIVEVQWQQAPNDRDVAPADATKRDADHGLSAAAKRFGIEQRVVEPGVDRRRAHDDAHDELAVDIRLLPVRQGKAADERTVLAQRKVDDALAGRQLLTRHEPHHAAIGIEPHLGHGALARARTDHGHAAISGACD